jgi:subtilisin family serine protease
MMRCSTHAKVAGGLISGRATTFFSLCGGEPEMKLHKLTAALALGLATCIAGSASMAAGPDSERVMVKFKPGAKGHVQRALQGAGAKFHYSFDGLNTFAVSVPAQAMSGLRNNPNIEYIEADALRKPMAQVKPYGIDMVKAPQVWAQGTNGSDIKVCVIDSGISARTCAGGPSTRTARTEPSILRPKASRTVAASSWAAWRRSSSAVGCADTGA